MAGGEILIGKHMLLRALMLDAVAGARRAEPGGSGHVKAVQEALEQAGAERIGTSAGVKSVEELRERLAAEN